MIEISWSYGQRMNWKNNLRKKPFSWEGGSHVWPRFSQPFFHKNGEFLCSLERKFPEFFKTYPTFVFSPLKWTKHKSRVSFEKFRKFPFQWTQKLPIFVKKQLRKLRSNMATLPLKYGIIWGHPADSSFAHKSLNFWLQMRKALPVQYCNNTQN